MALCTSMEALDLHGAIIGTEGHVAARLTAAACLARVCTSERLAKQMPEDGTQRPTFKQSYINTSIERGSFKTVIACMETATKVSSLTALMCRACSPRHSPVCTTTAVLVCLW